MITIYVVIIKATSKDFYYTTKTAIGRAHKKDEIGISPSTVKDVKFDEDGVYANSHCIIKKRMLLNNTDVK